LDHCIFAYVSWNIKNFTKQRYLFHVFVFGDQRISFSWISNHQSVFLFWSLKSRNKPILKTVWRFCNSIYVFTTFLLIWKCKARTFDRSIDCSKQGFLTYFAVRTTKIYLNVFRVFLLSLVGSKSVEKWLGKIYNFTNIVGTHIWNYGKSNLITLITFRQCFVKMSMAAWGVGDGVGKKSPLICVTSFIDKPHWYIETFPR